MRKVGALFLSLLVPLVVGAQNAEMTPAMDWVQQEVGLSQEVRLEAHPTNSNQEILHLPGGDSLILDNSLSDRSDEATLQKNLTDAERKELQDVRRDILLSVTRMALEKRLTSLSLVSGDKALHLAPAESSLTELGLTAVTPIEEVLGVGTEEQTKPDGKFKTFLKFVNEAVLLSTVRAAKDFYTNRQALRGITNEFGLQITLKAEFQFGMGKINITKNLPLVLSLGYKKDTRQVLLRIGRRTEAMSGGTAFSAGVKMEVRKYSMISARRDPRRLTVEGVSWYPPSIPMVSLVADTGSTYRSAGAVFGVNVADLIPGMYFINTVNGFTEKDLFVGSIRLPAMPSWIKRASSTLKRWVVPAGAKAPSCQLIFAN